MMAADTESVDKVSMKCRDGIVEYGIDSNESMSEGRQEGREVEIEVVSKVPSQAWSEVLTFDGRK